MSEKETKEEVKKEEGTEEVDLDFNIEDLPEDASQEDKDKAIKTLTAQKAHWRKKHDDLVEANKGGEGKEEKTEEKKETGDKPKGVDALPQSDVMTLIRNDIHENDIPEIVDYAQMKGLTIAEALKTPVVQSILDTNKEARTVEDATNTGKTGKTASGISDDELLANAKKGIMPESDADMDRLAKLRLGV